MKLLIDNHDLTGVSDYTEFLDAGNPPKITRELNQPSRLLATIVGEVGELEAPQSGANIWVERADGSRWFSGYIESSPQQQLAGYGLNGTVVRYRVTAKSDEFVLDRAPLDGGITVAQDSAANTLQLLTGSASASNFDTSGVVDVGDVKVFNLKDGERWSEMAHRLSDSCRASYTAENGLITLQKIERTVHELNDADDRFIPEALAVEQQARGVSDWTVVGEVGPGSYVKDYFIGDGHTLRFPMSMQPFLRPSVTVLEEEYSGDLSPLKWAVTNPSYIQCGGGRLILSGGSGVDGSATLTASQLLELGGCMVLEHGALVVTSASDGVIGGLYEGSIAVAKCLAGFGLSSAGTSTNLQAVVNGVQVGAAVPITYGHRYELSTRLYSSEVYRIAQSYRWSGGEESAPQPKANIRFVMEVRDLDSGTPIPSATVIHEGVVNDAVPLANYAVVNSTSIHGTIAYTRVRRMPTAEVRTTSIADGTTRTRIVGLISDGAECSVTTGPAVYFYAPYRPANGDQIVVRYRAAEHAAFRVFDLNGEPGAGSEMVRVVSPIARTAEDCRSAASALVKDSRKAGYKASYETWTDLLPSGEISPGDSIHLKAESRGLDFKGVVRTVESELVSGAEERARIELQFAEEGAQSIGLEIERFTGTLQTPVRSMESGKVNLVPAIGGAEVIAITSTSVQIDAGADVPVGGGIEVRHEGDYGWGEGNDRNLIGRFTTRVFTAPRSTRAEDYYMRMYDSGVPRNYSPITTLLHVDVKDDSI